MEPVIIKLPFINTLYLIPNCHNLTIYVLCNELKDFLPLTTFLILVEYVLTCTDIKNLKGFFSGDLTKHQSNMEDKVLKI